MKKIVRKYIPVLMLLFSSNTLYAQYSIRDFAPLHGLTGNWKMITKKGFLMEHWYINNDSTMHNKSYRVHGTDTIPQETVQLSLRNGSITYTSSVADQNNQQPVTFTLTKMENGKYIFENRAHDFPQQISYQLADKNTLNAGISGNIKFKHREILFNFKREL